MTDDKHLIEQPDFHFDEDEFMMICEEATNRHFNQITKVPQELVEKTKEASFKTIECVVKCGFAPGTKEFRKAMKELEEQGCNPLLIKYLLEDHHQKFGFLKRWLQKIFRF